MISSQVTPHSDSVIKTVFTWFCFLFTVLGTEPKASHIIGKHPINLYSRLSFYVQRINNLLNAQVINRPTEA